MSAVAGDVDRHGQREAHPRRARRLLLAGVLALTACSGSMGRPPSARPATFPAQPSAPPGGHGTAPTTTPSPPATYGGASVAWPRLPHTTPAPPATGAIRTTTRVRLVGGGTLAPGLVLPRLGGTASQPTVLTPCERSVTITGGRFAVVPPSANRRTIVVLDPGHGGHADGAIAADGMKEKALTLALAREVRARLPRDIDVVLTRDRDMDAGLGYRVALADRLRADLAVALHFDAVVNPRFGRVPGAQVYGALSDRHGRRAAGVIYQAERRYLDGLTARVGGRWTHGIERGALYRRGANGDYYFLLRESHVPWVISEPLFITTEREARLAESTRSRSGLAAAVARGIVDYLDTHDPGSGWRRPVPRPPDPPPPPGQGGCTDPA